MVKEMSIATGFYVPSTLFFSSYFASPLLKILRSFLSTECFVIYTFFFIPKTLSFFIFKQSEICITCCFCHQFRNMMKNISIYKTYLNALISNVYLFKLRVLSFIAQHRILFISFCRFHSFFKICFFLSVWPLISLDRLILSVTSFQLQLLCSAAPLHFSFHRCRFLLLSLQFVK